MQQMKCCRKYEYLPEKRSVLPQKDSFCKEKRSILREKSFVEILNFTSTEKRPGNSDKKSVQNLLLIARIKIVYKVSWHRWQLSMILILNQFAFINNLPNQNEERKQKNPSQEKENMAHKKMCPMYVLAVYYRHHHQFANNGKGGDGIHKMNWINIKREFGICCVASSSLFLLLLCSKSWRKSIENQTCTLIKMRIRSFAFSPSLSCLKRNIIPFI